MDKAKAFDEFLDLISDLRTSKSEITKNLVESAIRKIFEEIKVTTDSKDSKDSKDSSSVQTSSVIMPVTVSDRNLVPNYTNNINPPEGQLYNSVQTNDSKPVYFDLLTKCSSCDIAAGIFVPAKPNDATDKVLTHVYSPTVERKDSDYETIIRSYDKHNNVLYENNKLSHLCVSYSDLLKETMKDIRKKMSDGKAWITSRFSEPTPEYANFNEPMYSDEDIAKINIPMVDPVNPLKPIDKEEVAEMKLYKKETKNVIKKIKKPEIKKSQTTKSSKSNKCKRPSKSKNHLNSNADFAAQEDRLFEDCI